MLIYRKAVPSDIIMVIGLQRKYLLRNLEPRDQGDGFLSIEYSRDQLERLNDELGIFVALEDDRLSGYLVVQTMEFARRSSLIAAMVRRFPDVLYRSRPLSEYRTFLYGPVCIDERSRGEGILEGLFNIMLRTVKGEYDAGVAFVSEQNPRSLRAHKHKLGMKVVDEFEFSGRKFRTLAFEIGGTKKAHENMGH